MKKIIFGITKLDLGGAERDLVDIANRLCKKFDITIFTIYSGGILEKELNKDIKLISLYNKKNIIIPLYLLLCGKKVYDKNLKDKFDVKIAFLEGPITRIFSFGKDKKYKIAWVHNDITKVFGKGIKSWLKGKIDKKIYMRYGKIIFVSQQNMKAFEEKYGKISNGKVIYNYINKERIIEKAKEKCIIDNYENEQVPVILTIARLVKQKALDRFIKVHKRLINENIKHKVYVVGDGQEKDNLQKLIEKLNVKDSFILLGSKENPYPYLKRADFFVLLSEYEGYGMVLEEAKVLNKYIVITDTAAKEAVKDYKKALILKNNVDAIFDGLKEVIVQFTEK